MAPLDIWHVWPERKKDWICNQLAIVTGVIFTYPLTKVSLRQMLSGQNARRVTSYTIHEGFFVLYRGVLPQIIQRCFSITGTFIVHQNYNITIKDYPKKKSKIYAAFLLGSIDSLFMPLERVQVILANKSYNQTYKNTWYCLQSLLFQHGLKELYRGFEIVYFRNFIGSIIFISLFLEKEKILYREEEMQEPPVLLYASRVLLDSLQGTMVSTFIHPLNVIRVFVHNQVGERYMHTHIALKQIYKEHGVHFFFNGLYINMVRSWMFWVVIAFSNESYKQIYKRYFQPEKRI